MVRKEKMYLNAIGVCTVLVLFTGFAGCGSSGTRGLEMHEPPPGVDEATALRAGVIADSNFVSAVLEKEAQAAAVAGQQSLQEAEPFWQVLDQQVEHNELDGIDREAFDREVNAGAEALQAWKDATNDGANKPALAAAKVHSETAREHLERAVTQDPFDRNARVLLAMTYYNLQLHFGEKRNFEQAAGILERLIRLERGEHGLFRLLAENYVGMKKWDRALLNFARAQTVLEETSFETPPDTSDLFFYAYAQGDAHARLHNARAAAQELLRAKELARSDQEKADVRNYLHWLNWDGGNLRASEQWDAVLALEREKNYQDAAAVAGKLLPTLQTERAQRAVTHKLAVMEFEFLGRRGKAAERMRRLFESLPAEVATRPGETARVYLNTYGAMLYSLGVDARDRGDRRIALAYFTKAVSFEWDQMARGLREMVTLVWNTPVRAIVYGEKALSLGANILSADETCELMSLMVKAHKSAGLYDRARAYFDKWKACQATVASKN